jgi:hypothetical protein
MNLIQKALEIVGDSLRVMGIIVGGIFGAPLYFFAVVLSVLWQCLLSGWQHGKPE